MRRAILLLLLVAVMLVSMIGIPAMAAAAEQPEAIAAAAEQARGTTTVIGLDIEGTTATCSLRAVANHISDDLRAVIRLYRGSTCIRVWTVTGNGYIFAEKTATVTKGYTYRMSVDLTVNGADFPVADVYKTI